MDKETLFKPRVDEAEVEIPGVGTVRVRGLTRHEVMSAQHRANDALTIERIMLAKGMVDPEITEAEAGQWQKIAPAGELEPVTAKIHDLSGMGEGASKSDLPETGEGTGSGVRTLPGGGAEHDGGPAEGGTV